ncbi:platelet formation protein family [Trichomonas vaginalis G3]|uniref:platelet formation protein family n=1 Tax=Trichomonas vaginalis (strain ATCC PRA-98 / G3) TaxID=412133 RepID=UPI0021E57BA3|nr:platelet formation protein family [Trichomonas vaginalis G3]KAI5493897.1 platelet formation protein family [Trichomonas vaginalis G3]
MENITNSYRFENHPIIQTLKLQVPAGIDEDSLPFDLLTFSSKKIIDENRLISLYNQITSGEKLTQCLSIFEIDFIFNYSCLNRIITAKEHNEMEYYYILHSAVCFCVGYSRNIDPEDVYLILNALFLIKSHPYHEISIYMVSYILFTISADIQRFDLLKILDIVRNILNCEIEIPRTITSSIIFLIYALGTRGPIDSKSETLFLFLSELNCYSNYSISETQAISLYDRCYYGLCSLNINCMTFMYNFITKVPWSVAELYFSKIGYLLANFLHQKDQKYLRNIIPILDDELSYIPQIALDLDKSSSQDGFALEAHQQNNYQLITSISFSSFSEIPSEKLIPCFDIQGSEDLATFHRSKINPKKLPDCFRLNSSLNSMIFNKFHEFSPYSNKYDKLEMKPKTELENLDKFDETAKIISNHVQCLVKLSRNYPRAKLSIYRSFIKVLKSKFDYDLAFSAVLFLTLQSEITDFKELTEIIYPKLFTPNCTIYDYPNGYFPLIQLRYMYFSLLLKWGNLDFLSFLDPMKTTPLLLSELVLYIIHQLDKNEVKLQLFIQIIDFIINAYPSFYNEFQQNQTSRELVTVSRSIFQLVLKLLITNFDLSITFLEKDYFISFILALHFDENIRKEVIHYVIPIWANVSRTSILNFLLLALGSYDNERDVDTEDYFKMITDCLNAAITIIDVRNESPKEYSVLIEKISILLASNTTYDVDVNLALSVMKFLTLISKYSTLSVSERQVFLNFLKKITPGPRDDELFDCHVDLIIGQINHNHLEITQHKYLYNFYSLFGLRAIDFLEKTFLISPINRLMCHLGQIDIRILEEFEEIDDQEINEIDQPIVVKNLSENQSLQNVKLSENQSLQNVKLSENQSLQNVKLSENQSLQNVKLSENQSLQNVKLSENQSLQNVKLSENLQKIPNDGNQKSSNEKDLTTEENLTNLNLQNSDVNKNLSENQNSSLSNEEKEHPNEKMNEALDETSSDKILSENVKNNENLTENKENSNSEEKLSNNVKNHGNLTENVKNDENLSNDVKNDKILMEDKGNQKVKDHKTRSEVSFVCKTEEPKKQLKKLENFFISIAKVASNIRVVYKLISLMSRKHLKMCMRIIIQCLLYKLQYPVASIPFYNNTNLINISKYDEGQNNINLCLWFLYTINSEKTNLFRSDLYDVYLEIYMDKNKIEVISNKEGVISYFEQTFSNLRPNVWSMIIFSFLPRQLTIYCAKEKVTFPISLDVRYTDEMTIGFMSQKPLISPFYLGPINLSYDEISQKDIIEMEEYGPRSHNINNNILSVNIDVSEDHICLQKNGKPNVKLSLNKMPGYLNFADALIRFFTANVLIPLFKKINDFKMKKKVKNVRSIFFTENKNINEKKLGKIDVDKNSYEKCLENNKNLNENESKGKENLDGIKSEESKNLEENESGKFKNLNEKVSDETNSNENNNLDEINPNEKEKIFETKSNEKEKLDENKTIEEMKSDIVKNFEENGNKFTDVTKNFNDNYDYQIQKRTEILIEVIDVFKSLFYVSPSSEVLFYEENGWVLISYLMRQMNPEFLDFNVYLRFCDILNQSQNVNFKHDLIKHILVNPLIWIYTRTEVALVVTHHWFNSLFPNLNFPVSFTHFLGIFLGSIWKCKENEIEALDSIRDQSVKTLVSVAEISFDIKDFDALMNTIVTANDKSIIISMIELLQNLTLSPKQILMKISQKSDRNNKSIEKVTTLFKLYDEEISLAIFRLLSILQTSHIFKTSLFVYQLESFNYHYANHEYSSAFLDQIYNLKDLQPDFIQVCFGLIYYNKNLTKHFLSYLEPNSCFALSKAWSFWPILAAVNCEKPEESQKIFEFVLNCTNKDWECGFLITMIISSSNTFIRQFLTIAAQKIRLLPRFFSEDMISNLLNLCMFYILFRPMPYTNYFFNRICGIENEIFDKNQDFVSLLELSQKPKEYTYGLNFDIDRGNWEDVDLSLACLEIITCIPSQNFNDLGSLFASFILAEKNGNQEVTNYVMKKIIPIFLNMHKPSNPFMSLLQYHMKKAGSTIPFTEKNSISQIEAIPLLLESIKPKVTYFSYELSKLATSILKQRKSCIDQKYSSETSRLPFSIFILENVFEAVDFLKRQTAFQWRHFWARMTLQCAPWEDINAKKPSLFKRDSTLCNFFCPMKMRVIDESEEKHTNYFSRSFSSKFEEIVKNNSEEDDSDEFSTSSSFSLFFSGNGDEDSESDDENEFVSKVLFSDKCQIVKIDRKHEATFVVTKSALVFDYDNEEQRVIESQNISHILRRYFHGNLNGLEVFNFDGESVLVKLHTKNAKEALKVISKRKEYRHCVLQTEDCSEMIEKLNVKQKWIEGKISNFEYLMTLNIFSGRSFNCECFYPVMPWIFQNFETNQLRDFNNLQMKSDEKIFETFLTPKNVFVYNMRVEPFMTKFFAMKEKSFKFNSLKEISEVYSQKVTELTPEFYFDPRIFENKIEESEEEIHKIILPKWANSPLEFVYFSRKYLERVNHLEKWIDLIWGIDQNKNNFDPDLFVDKIPQKGDRYRKEEKMHKYGQIPPQIFTSPHPEKLTYDSTILKEFMSFSVPVDNVLCGFFSPQKQTVFIVTDDGKLLSSNYESEVTEIMKFDISSVQTRKGKFGVITDDENIVFATKNGSLLTIDINKKTQKTISAHFAGVNCISISKRLIVSGGDDTRLHAITSDSLSPLFSVATYDDELTCCHVSQNFHLAIACTHCGNVFAIDTRRREITWQMSLEEGSFPRNVVVTDSWGFIVIHYTTMVEGNEIQKIAVLTIDGEIHETFEVDINVAHIAKLTSRDGFDFVLIVGEKGRIWSFEAFYGEKALNQFANCASPVTNVFVADDNEFIYTITINGRIQIIPSEYAVRNIQV